MSNILIDTLTKLTDSKKLQARKFLKDPGRADPKVQFLGQTGRPGLKTAKQIAHTGQDKAMLLKIAKEAKGKGVKRTPESEALKKLHDPVGSSSRIQFLGEGLVKDFDFDMENAKHLMNCGFEKNYVIKTLMDAYPEKAGRIKVRLGG